MTTLDPNRVSSESSIPRDRNDWPIVPTVDGTSSLICHRPSGFGKAFLTDSFAIGEWQKRAILKGAGVRPDLASMAAPLDLTTDKDKLNAYVLQAKEAGGAARSANEGTARHSWLELLLEGGSLEGCPADALRDVDAMARCLDEAGVVLVPGWSERFVVEPTTPAAGSPDAYVTSHAAPGVTVLDLKTGNDPRKFSTPVEHSTQLAIYARAQYAWAGEGHPLEPMPAEMNLDVAFILWAPLGEGRAELVPMDIAEGWALVQLGCQVRDRARRKVRRLVLPLEVSAPIGNGVGGFSSTSLAQRVVGCRRRCRDLVDQVPEFSGADLGARWPDGFPSLRHTSAWSVDMLETIEALLETVEGELGLVAVPADQVEAMAARVDALPADMLAIIHQVQADEGVPNLRSPLIRQRHVDLIDGGLGALEVEVADRLSRLFAAVDAAGGPVTAAGWAEIMSAGRTDDPEQLVALEVDAVVHRVERGGDPVDLGGLLELLGSKSAVLAAGKAAADAAGQRFCDVGRPRSAASVVASALLGELVLMGERPAESDGPTAEAVAVAEAVDAMAQQLAEVAGGDPGEPRAILCAPDGCMSLTLEGDAEALAERIDELKGGKR